MVVLQKEAVSATVDVNNEALTASTTKLECDYDVSPTELYQAIEAGQWQYVMNMFHNGEETKENKVKNEEKKVSVAEQAITWVVRKESDGRLRWRMLPLHALMIFKAPFRVVDAILSVAPSSVNSKDDRGMVPLHLAFRHEADDESLIKIISMSPGAIEMKDRKGRTPLQMVNPTASTRGKLIQEYTQTALVAERRKVSEQLNVEQQRKMDALKNAYELEIAALKKKISHTEAEVKSARTACNAMMTRVANMSSIEKQLREDNDKLREQKSEKEQMIAGLESKVSHINTVYCSKDKLHAEALKRFDEEQCAVITLEDKIDNVEKNIATKDEQYTKAIEVIAEKDDLISTLYERVDLLDTLNKTKEEEIIMAQLKCEEAEREVKLNSREKNVLEEYAEGAKVKTCNLSSTIENLTCRNAHLEKELEIQEKKGEQQRHWLDNAHQVFGKMLNSSSANWNNAREKIILASDTQKLELQLVADNRERAAIAKEIAVLKSGLDKLIAKEGEIPNSMSAETVESFF